VEQLLLFLHIDNNVEDSMPAQTIASPWITLAEAAEYLRVTTRAIRRWIAEGKLNAYKLAGGHTVRLRRDEVEALLERMPTAASA
jgi:excisionase family DNA binding protein